MMKERLALMLVVWMAADGIGQGSNTSVKKNDKPNADPAAARIVTSDIALFWEAYSRATPENDLIVYRDQYLKKGTAGLKDFTRTRISNSCGLVDAIQRHPKYYAALRDISLKVESYKDSMRESFRKLQKLYGDSVFPDVYFLIGRMNSAGTVTDAGLLIGVDMFGRTKDTALEELDDWHKAVIKPIEEIPFIVAHELIHYQQKYPKLSGGGTTLLQQVVKEGSADFIAELIAGHHGNEKLHVYGDPREKELWLEFKKELPRTDASSWLYQEDKAKDRPADLGYYVGYKICESYYRNATDKKQAVKDTLEIKDFDKFLKASRYEEKLKVT